VKTASATMKSAKHPSASSPSPDRWPAAAKQQLAELLDGLLPPKKRADWRENDPMVLRNTVPKDRRDRLERFATLTDEHVHHRDGPCIRNSLKAPLPPPQMAVYYHPDNYLCAVPKISEACLAEQIREELNAQARADRWGKVEILHDVSADAKGRWRISCVLSDRVGIKGNVVFCRRGWRIEIWAQETLGEQPSTPLFSPASPHSPAGSNAETSSPGGSNCR
jgi:DNA-binding transcriptional regulator/RsmH inhibitor MraZ